MPRALAALALCILAVAAARAAAEDARVLRWPELIPAHLADAPVRPPPIEDHAGPADLTQLSPWGDLPMSELVVPEVDGEQVRISGFVVPLHMTGEDRVDEFLLVPYFGACVHVPPPPPNQVIHVVHERGLDAGRIYDPWTVFGTLRVRGTSNAMADAGYTLEARTLRLYDG